MSHFCPVTTPAFCSTLNTSQSSPATTVLVFIMSSPLSLDPTPIRLSASQLRSANLEQLKLWARKINNQSHENKMGKAIRTISLRKAALRQAIADYLNVDLLAHEAGDPSEDAGDIKPVPDLIQQDIQRKQYEFALSEYEKWGNVEPYDFGYPGEQNNHQKHKSSTYDLFFPRNR